MYWENLDEPSEPYEVITEEEAQERDRADDYRELWWRSLSKEEQLIWQHARLVEFLGFEEH